MKKLLFDLRLPMLLLATTSLGFGIQLEHFEFDDSNGTLANNALNTGIPGTLAHPLFGTNTYTTNGSGQAVYISDGTNVTQNRSLPSTVSTGKLYLRADFGGHTLASSATSKAFIYGFRDSASTSQLYFRLLKTNSDEMRISVGDINGVADVFTAVNIGYAGLTDSAGIGTLLALDLDARTYDFYTDVGLTGVYLKVLGDVALGDPASVTNVDQLRFNVQSHTAGDSVTVERLVMSNDLDTVLLSATAPKVPDDLFEMDDTAGTAVTSATNTGLPGTDQLPFFGAGSGNIFETNGSGQAVFQGLGGNAGTSRLLDVPRTTGTLFLRMDLAGHDLAASANQKVFGYGFRDDTTGSQLLLRLVKPLNASEVRISILDDNAGTANDVPTSLNIGYAGLSDTSGVGAILGIDLDAETYDVYTDVGLTGVFKQVVRNQALAIPNSIATLDNIRAVIQNLDTTDTVTVERVAYSKNLSDILLTSTLASGPAELFEFDDAASTVVTAAENTGQRGTLSLPAFATSTYAANGSGQAEFTYAAQAFTSATLPDTLTSGTVYLRKDIAGHSIAASSSRAIFSYGFRDSVSTSQIMVRLLKLEDTSAEPNSIRISVQDDDNVGLSDTFNATNIDYAGLVDNDGISTVLALNITAGTYDLYTDVGLTGIYTKVVSDVALGTPATFQTNGVNQLRFITQNMTVGDSVTVERIAYSDSEDILLSAVAPLEIDTFSVPGANFLALPNTDAPNGFSIIGNGIADYSDATNLFSSRALSSPINSGKAYLRLDVSEYTIVEDSFDNYQIGLRDTDGDLVSFQFAGSSAGNAKRLRTATSIAGGSVLDVANVFEVANLGDSFAPSVILEIDIDNDEYSAYLENGGTYFCVVGPLPLQDAVATPVDMGPITEVRMAILDMEATDVVGIDFIMISDDFDSIANYTPPPNPVVGTGDIVITDVSVSGGNLLATFTSPTNVDVYSSTSLESFGALPILTDVAPGIDVILDTAALPRNFYILVPTGSPAP